MPTNGIRAALSKAKLKDFKMMAVVPLAAMRPGEVGEVVDICGDERLVARLGERGLRKGCRLEALSVGQPLLFKIDETRLSLRTDGQIEVLVQV